MFNSKITGYVFPDSYYARILVVYSVSLNRIRIRRNYISCSVSWSGPWPDLPVSARSTRTDAGTRELMQGMIQNKTCNNVFITYLQQKKMSHTCTRVHLFILNSKWFPKSLRQMICPTHCIAHFNNIYAMTLFLCVHVYTTLY